MSLGGDDNHQRFPFKGCDVFLLCAEIQYFTGSHYAQVLKETGLVNMCAKVLTVGLTKEVSMSTGQAGLRDPVFSLVVARRS